MRLILVLTLVISAFPQIILGACTKPNVPEFDAATYYAPPKENPGRN